MTATLAFVMDPIDRINAETDTTFAFMLAASERGHRVVYVRPADVSLVDGNVLLIGQQMRVRPDAPHFEVVSEVRVEAPGCAAIFVRTDPPFDEAYLTVSWILSIAEEQGVRIINSPRGLRAASEHLYSLYYPDLCPATVVTSSHSELVHFVEKVGGTAIGKPIDGHGGFGVVRLTLGDSNLNALIDMLTLEGRQPIIAQEYLPEIEHGDKRLIIVDGELRGCLRRMPAQGDHRGNVHVGGVAVACKLNDHDRAIAAAMRDRLRADGLYFVGVDTIGDRLIEVNVTSPTLLRELKRLGGPDLAAEIVDEVAGG